MWGYVCNYDTYSFYITQCNGLQGAVVQNAADQTRNIGANSFREVDWVLYVHLSTQRTNGFTSHLKDEEIMVNYLA